MSNIDENTFASIQELMGANFSVMIEKYKESTSGYLADIEAGMASGDAEKVQNAAHPFKSSSASLGFLALSEVAKKIEHTASEEGDVSDLQNDCTELKAAYADVMAFLDGRDL